MVNSDDCGDSIFLDFDRKMGKEKRYETTIPRKLIDCCKTLSNGGIDLNSALKRRNYGSIWNTGICVWTDSIYSGSKTNKQTKGKMNSRRELQGRLMHQTNQLNHSGIKSL